MTVQEFLGRFGAELDHDARTGVDYAGIIHVTPDEFRRFTGRVADFSRPASAGYGDDPVSVAYSAHPLTGQYVRTGVSYSGPCELRGPLGGSHVSRLEPVTFVVTH